MRPPRLSQLSLLLLICAASTQGVAIATGGDTAAPVVADTTPPQPFGIGQPLDRDALDAMRGGESIVQVSTHNDGEVDGNTANGVVSGSNSIGGDAFANAAGISTVIQNSGSNVLIQNGTAVNVLFVDPMP